MLAKWLRRPPQERRTRGLIPAFSVGIFPGRLLPVIQKLPFQWQSYQAPGVIGSALGLVGPMSVYYDWVRLKV